MVIRQVKQSKRFVSKFKNKSQKKISRHRNNKKKNQ